jgi:hypothetical protein
MAQSNASGTVYGRVAPGTATSVVLKNLDTNQTRTVQIDASGAFQATALAVGPYRATLQGGSAAGQVATMDVVAGQGADAVFAASGAPVTSVEVTGRRTRIDVSNASNGATFTARELAKLPIGKNVDAIIQLAPNTTRSDPTYPAGASIGGGGPSENAYYINGFPVTNPLTQLGASELPFGAIATAEIKTGGFGVEFGRSVGGVVNITGKSGTNNWEVGGLASITPAKLRKEAKDQYFPNSGLANSGLLRFRNSENTVKSTQLGAYLGGPIVQDKLFAFAAVEETDTDFGTVIGGATTAQGTNDKNGFRARQARTLRYYTKTDWNITDDHRLEFTTIGDLPNQDTQFKGYNYSTHAVGTTVNSATHEENNGANGGEVQVLRYTGNLTDNLTMTAMYGKSRATHLYEPAGYNPTLMAVTAATENRAPGLNYASGQPFTGSLPFSGATDDIEAKRIDFEYKLGSHLLRAGADKNTMSSLHAGNIAAGGGTWIYGKTSAPGAPTSVPGGSIPALTNPALGPLAGQGYYVNKNIFVTASNAYASQDAQYIEDKWQVTKNLLVVAGIRSESFSNSNSDKVKYLEQKNQLTPRLSAVWDMNGDSTMKVFGSAGRYTVQMPTIVAIRGANGSLNTSQYYAYTGTDSNGLPTGLTQLTTPLSANGEFGQAKDPTSLSSTNLKPSYQDELTLGFEKQFSPSLNFGAKVTYRKLRNTIDDFCDGRPFKRYALDNKIATSNDATFDPEDPGTAYPYFSCASFNPGYDQDFLIDYMGNGKYTKVHLTAKAMGFEKASRVYEALDLFAEHPLRNGWYGKINYTLGRSTGNTEGQTNSGLNTGQADVAATITWDYAELMKYSNGLLPNDRKHQIKAFGYWELTPEWTVGGNLAVQSGRPKGCLGQNPDAYSAPDWQQVGISPDYGVEHYCFGVGTPKTATAPATPSYVHNVPAPAGTMGRLPWTKTLDLNVVYRPSILKDLSLKMDVFNVLNSQDVLKLNEQYNSGGNISTTFGAVNSFSAPRSVKFSAEFNHKF